MLRCCHFHHLKCCHFRCRSLVFALVSGGVGGFGSKREEVWEDFHFKQAKLCPSVTWLPQQPLLQCPPTSCLLLAIFPFNSCLLLFSPLPSSLSRIVFPPWIAVPIRWIASHRHLSLMCRMLHYFPLFPPFFHRITTWLSCECHSRFSIHILY